jgi:hypothetical protein
MQVAAQQETHPSKDFNSCQTMLGVADEHWFAVVFLS